MIKEAFDDEVVPELDFTKGMGSIIDISGDGVVTNGGIEGGVCFIGPGGVELGGVDIEELELVIDNGNEGPAYTFVNGVGEDTPEGFTNGRGNKSVPLVEVDLSKCVGIRVSEEGVGVGIYGE